MAQPFRETTCQMIEKLLAENVNALSFSFSGGGDSGTVENPQGHKVDPTRLKNQNFDPNSFTQELLHDQDATNLDKYNLIGILDTFTLYEYQLGDWWNNAGGEGAGFVVFDEIDRRVYGYCEAFIFAESHIDPEDERITATLTVDPSRNKREKKTQAWPMRLGEVCDLSIQSLNEVFRLTRQAVLQELEQIKAKMLRTEDSENAQPEKQPRQHTWQRQQVSRWFLDFAPEFALICPFLQSNDATAIRMISGKVDRINNLGGYNPMALSFEGLVRYMHHVYGWRNYSIVARDRVGFSGTSSKSDLFCKLYQTLANRRHENTVFDGESALVFDDNIDWLQATIATHIIWHEYKNGRPDLLMKLDNERISLAVLVRERENTGLIDVSLKIYSNHSGVLETNALAGIYDFYTEYHGLPTWFAPPEGNVR